MVTRIDSKGKTFYKCDVCGLVYPEKDIAEKCQDWCETHDGSCNIEYTQHAVELEV